MTVRDVWLSLRASHPYTVLSPASHVEAFPGQLRTPSLHRDGLGISTSIKTAAILHSYEPDFHVRASADRMLRPKWIFPALRMLTIRLTTTVLVNVNIRSWCAAVKCSSSAGKCLWWTTLWRTYRYNVAFGPGRLFRPGLSASAIKPSRFIGGNLAFMLSLRRLRLPSPNA